MSLILRNLLNRYFAPANGEGEDLPGTGDGLGDYGDDFTPTGDDALDKGKSGGTGKDAAGGEGESEGEGEGEGGDKGKDQLRDGAGTGDSADGKDGGDDKEHTGTPKTGKGKFIPLDRHEKLLKKERARREEAEAQLEHSRAGQQVAKINASVEKIENDLVSMEEKYNELLAEGDTKNAAALMTQIRRKNAELTSVLAEQHDAEIMARAVEKVRFEEAIERIEQAYPELDPDADEYDADVYQDVVDLMYAGQKRGLSPVKSLQRAVQRVMGADTGSQKRATTVHPRVDEESVAEELAAKRRGEAVKRNLDVARRTPPATHRAGSGNDAAGGALTAKAVMSMSDEDFNKLSEKDLARLRGDEL